MSTALRTSSTTHVPTIRRSSSECVQGPWLIVSAVAEHNGNISLGIALIWKNSMVQFPRRQNFTFNYPLPSQSVRRTVCTHVHFWVAHRKFPILTNVRVQTDNIHIMDFFPLLNSAISFCGLSSTPVQGIADIYSRILHIGVRGKFIFKAWILT